MKDGGRMDGRRLGGAGRGGVQGVRLEARDDEDGEASLFDPSVRVGGSVVVVVVVGVWVVVSPWTNRGGQMLGRGWRKGGGMDCRGRRMQAPGRAGDRERARVIADAWEPAVVMKRVVM
ncbi:hypothetical protein AXG93_1913s1590 [Marchantia polymorpha subsp. ruderalis]|uniref:Uncharacterized protein n=1 Tax=Marchantia polymorpha subsp. ruderalis TaxID=1480154 RepID=A0A176WIX0_MARPO|nr:hypothetical protein AXG93_1913s1590 [Marchantia polymorpha subsp. ruderalis]